MAASTVRAATGSSLGGGSSGYHTGMRSPSSSVCSFAGSATSEPMYQHNKYLMKTLCLSKKSPMLPGKAEYANLLTCGLGARKWLASLEFDAESFKAAIINIYPRLATVPSYSLWNVKPDKSLEKLPCMVNTPKRIKAYLGSTFTGSLVIMPSEEISLGPVKVPPMNRNIVNGNSAPSSRSSKPSSNVKSEKESGYESFQEYPGDSFEKPPFGPPMPSSHKHTHINGSSFGRNGRHICLTCGRLAKQVGSTSFYDINNTSTFSTSEGYMSIAKKLKELFHLELPRSKIVQSEQICRKCFRALNEIHFLETQLKRSKEEMMATLLSTISKINRLEHMARDASSSGSSSDSTTTLGSLMNMSALNPWIQEARYVLEQKNMQRPEPNHEPPRQTDSPPFVPTTTGAVAIFQGPHPHTNGDRNYVDYNSPQPVFLAPLAGFAPQGSDQGKLNFEKHDAIYKKRSTTMVPLNMSILSNPPKAHGPPNGRRSPPNNVSPPPTTSSNSNSAIYLGKSAPIYFAATSVSNSPRGQLQSSNGGRSEEQSHQDQEEIEKQMAEEEEAAANEAAEREHSATAFLEEAYRRRKLVAHEAGKNNSGNMSGNGSCSSRGSSIMGNNCSSSPCSQSPSPPVVNSRTPENLTVMVQPSEIPTDYSCADPRDEGKNGNDSKSSSSKGSPSPNGVHAMRRPWKKRYHEVLDAEHNEESSSGVERAMDKKRARTVKMEGRLSTEHRSDKKQRNGAGTESSSTNDPVSTSSGSPDQMEDLMSEDPASPKNGTNENMRIMPTKY